MEKSLLKNLSLFVVAALGCLSSTSVIFAADDRPETSSISRTASQEARDNARRSRAHTRSAAAEVGRREIGADALGHRVSRVRAEAGQEPVRVRSLLKEMPLVKRRRMTGFLTREDFTDPTHAPGHRVSRIRAEEGQGLVGVRDLLTEMPSVLRSFMTGFLTIEDFIYLTQTCPKIRNETKFTGLLEHRYFATNVLARFLSAVAGGNLLRVEAFLAAGVHPDMELERNISGNVLRAIHHAIDIWRPNHDLAEVLFRYGATLDGGTRGILVFRINYGLDHELISSSTFHELTRVCVQYDDRLSIRDFGAALGTIRQREGAGSERAFAEVVRRASSQEARDNARRSSYMAMEQANKGLLRGFK
ncbi:MAG: hypothetical protein K0R52_863 [Alphaproteobacteria bacterium]|jgi:hypothetical protein|nr:hypothetical protein [Alphaproteobacteria bacterium]